MPRILVVDDDRDTCRFMEELLHRPGHAIELAYSPEDALSRAERESFDVIVSDINLNAERSGIDLLRAFKKADARVEVVLISGFGTLETAIAAVGAGAFDYISKPFDIGEVKDVVDRALRRRAKADEAEAAAVTEPSPPDGLIGRSRGMLSVYKQIARALASEAPVLITGETGTGKELVAHAIHRNGRRAAWPFVGFNCGALAEGILESELFGHVRGSFTGAVVDKKGLFEQAHGGTLFLDEIGETSPAVQVKLLRALEEGEVRPVGGSRAVTVNVRVIAATNRDLDRAVAEGIFRRDLFFRLNVFPVPVPPLRERRDDIPLLVGHFLRVVAERSGKTASLTPEAMTALQAYRWPGNVRELENAVERLVLEGAGGSIDAGDLPPAMRARPASLKERLFEDLPSLQEIEKRYLVHVLGVMKGNRSRAAEVLGIDRRTLYRMAERFGIELPEDK